MRRRDFIKAIAGSVAAWPLAARAQQAAMPVIGVVGGGGGDISIRYVTAFRKGLIQTGTIEDQSATVEYHWLAGQYDRLPSLMADLVRRRVAVITTPGSNPAALAAKAATTTIPIVFGVGEDPVKLGLVASLARPGGNATGINIFNTSGSAFCMSWYPTPLGWPCWSIQLMPPAPSPHCDTSRKLHAPLGCKVKCSTRAAATRSILATLVRERADVLFVAPDAFFISRRVQFATLTARDKIPAAYADREIVEAGGLMSYGSDFADMFRQVGIYAGRILKGEKPSDLPVVQATKFELVINLRTAKAFGLDVPPSLLARADEVIE